MNTMYVYLLKIAFAAMFYMFMVGATYHALKQINMKSFFSAMFWPLSGSFALGVMFIPELFPKPAKNEDTVVVHNNQSLLENKVIQVEKEVAIFKKSIAGIEQLLLQNQKRRTEMVQKPVQIQPVSEKEKSQEWLRNVILNEITKTVKTPLSTTTQDQLPDKEEVTE